MDQYFTVAKQAQGIKEKDELTALHPGAFKCKCKKHVIAVNIYSRSECNMDFICTKLCCGAGGNFLH